ncbi:MAG TPA: thioredoxin domain-containing protein [Solirubrobacterales bacterium]
MAAAPAVPSRRPPRRRWTVILALAIPAIAIVLAIVFISVGEGGALRVEITGASETQRLMGGILQDGDRLGDPDAPVTITYFTDLQCEGCAIYHREVIPPLIEDLVRDGDAKLELRHFSTAENETQAAAYAATAAGEQERQWQYANIFFLNLGKVPGDPPRLTTEFLEQVAGGVLELDESDWEDAIDTDEVQATVESDAQEAIELLLPAEPAMVVAGPGGERVLKASPTLDDVETAVAEVR